MTRKQKSKRKHNPLKGINTIRLALLKKELLKGKSQAQAMRDAGFSPETARSRVANCKSLKIVKAEIERDIKKEITVETVLAGLNHIQQLATEKCDFSTAVRCEELKGKWLAMFTDRQLTGEIEREDNQFSLDRLSKMRV